MSRRFDADGIIVGLVFMVAGGLFLLERLGVLELRADIVWPSAVIAVGAVVVLKALMRRG